MRRGDPRRLQFERVREHDVSSGLVVRAGPHCSHAGHLVDAGRADLGGVDGEPDDHGVDDLDPEPGQCR